MYKAFVGVTALLTAATLGFAQPKAAIDITKAQIDEVLKQGALRKPPSVDNTLRVIDMGGYALSVAVVHRGPTGQPAGGAGRGAGAGRAQQAAANVEHCGLASAPAGAQQGPPGMIEHDDTVETYIVISGSGTLVTGGEILNGTRSGPDSEVTKILNGPSCSGRVVGDFVSRKLNVGDISVIPAGVPHGWTGITEEVTYLSVRPDPKKVLEHGYVNPFLK
jgi:mannose-6-phosphate isomerase-like protein (cupin superfamily)